MSNQPNPEQKVVLTLADLQVVLNYLAARPYSEVFTVIETVKKARTLETVVAETEQETSGETSTTSEA